jgi:hypothetical protein
MLYPRNEEMKLNEELFRNPTKEYRGTPFWAWNTKMTKTHIENTLNELKEMGMGGAHIHSRTGLDVPYLSEEFLDLVKYTHEYAKEKDMLTWLYDEDRWPSGAAGGLVTKDEKYRIRFLVFTTEELSEKGGSEDCSLDSSAKAVRSNNRRFLAKYEVLLKHGYLTEYNRIDKQQEAAKGYDTWYAYLEISGNNAWFNNQTYLNTLDKAAVERFIQVTHEAYYRELGDSFGTSIPAIFTDEPQFSHKTMLGFAEDKVALTIPYTDDFEESYQKAYGVSFLEHLPEVFWDLPGLEISVNRYHYHDHVCERFTEAFADTVGGWCREHNLLLAGHMMEEPTLHSQTSALGEAMRSYRSFGIPGIDMLCDRRELTTAKQAQSAAHQYACPGVLSEIYGVTNWDFDFRGHKLAGDWQAALGVTVRVHHLTWTSMAGEAKRDYPAPIGYQSPWYKEYTWLEDYFARINTALTRGKAVVKVGVIHPIESFWLYWGTKEHTEGIRREMDTNFLQLVKWLLYGLIDFDFIAESLLPQLQPWERTGDSDGFLVGAMEYDVILVPNCITLRRSTLERLEAFVKRGGKVIFAGNTPTHIDAVASEELPTLLRRCTHIEFNENSLLESLTSYREIDIRNQHGMRTENILYQLREEENGKWLFLAHSEKPHNPDLTNLEALTICINGIVKPTKYHTFTGELTPCHCYYNDGKTYLKEEIYDHDSLLYYLETEVEEETTMLKGLKADNHLTGSPETIDKEELRDNDILTGSVEAIIQEIKYPSRLQVTLSEPNVLLLDMAEYRFDLESWFPQEELLRIDNQYRGLLGYPFRTEAYAQPWLSTGVEHSEHTLSLRFQIHTECEICAPLLALEDAEAITITLNGTVVPSKVMGWYTDRDIQTILLPDLLCGTNTLEITIPYHSKRNVEYLYLLGDFSVSVAGRNTVLGKPIKELAFGDICMQGLPFYGGNITYEIPVHTVAGRLNLQAAQFRCPILKTTLDGQEKGCIALSPYTIDLGRVKEGDHTIGITVYGNRVNTFGPVHNCNHTEHWHGPNAWRTTGTAWAYEYQLKKSGILVSPTITLEQ